MLVDCYFVFLTHHDYAVKSFSGVSFSFHYNWRASLASETLTGVTQSKIGDVYLLASERSERDTLTGVKSKKSGMFVYYWRASEASQTLSGVTQSRFRYIYWRASVASETLTGVTQSKIGDVCWRASEASETVLGVDNAKSGIMLYVYMYICMYVWIVRMPFKRARAGNFFLKNNTAF